MTDGGDSRLL